MARTTGTYRISKTGEEEVRAFTPHPLPPADPPLAIDDRLSALLASATNAVDKLAVAADMVPNADWFLYGFVRKEAVVSSQIEGTQATLGDVLEFEATEQTDRPDDVQEVCNYVDALAYARREMARPKGLPLSTRLLCQIHKRLMKGARGADKEPGEVRRTQNWVGGTRPGNATFVPPPPEMVPEALAELDKWIHGDDPLPPLVRAGLAHVQFETIHPFLDGNGRVGRLLITLLIEHWKLLPAPLLYLSLAFKRHRAEYYNRLSAVRTDGDWEGWCAFYLECVRESACDAVAAAQALFNQVNADRQKVTDHKSATVTAIRLFDQLPSHPFITVTRVMQMLDTTKPTAIKAIDALEQAGVIEETTGRQRDRVYAYHKYLRFLTEGTE